MNSPALKSVEDLRNEIFFIPSYQRGYRWGKRDVGSLIEDIWDFAKLENQKEEDFYCLQPIIIKKGDKGWRVIDGQQRLTTLFLIIRFLKKFSPFKITYQTRENSSKFLDEIENNLENDNLDIDFFHFVQAYKTISSIFKQQDISKEIFFKTLMERSKILWYETNENENEVFIRLNIGKIPLLEAENIKALFLLSSNGTPKELAKKADFWYKSEKKAREKNDFRYCVLNKIDKKDITINEQGFFVLKDDILRIEAYLKAIVPPVKNPYYLFDYFYASYRENNLNSRWEELKNCINNFESFSSHDLKDKEGREIFHYLGFLILNNEKIFEIYNLWIKHKSKNKFKEELFNKVVKKMGNKICKLDDLNYNNNKDREALRSILLLFNLEYLIRDESKNHCFEFNRFALEQWSLEHIYAQNSKSISNAIEKKDINKVIEWLDEILKYIDGHANQYELNEKIQKFKKKKSLLDEEKNRELFDMIDKSFKNSETLNDISNLTLLDKRSNSSFGNLIFSQKRKKIESLAKEDKLIPIMTRKVFEKSIKDLDFTHKDIFSKSDRDAYKAYIKHLISKYRGK